MGTWSGDECNAKCEAQKGIVCGRIYKDCCAMECQGTLTKSCKFDLKLSRKNMSCGAWDQFGVKLKNSRKWESSIKNNHILMFIYNEQI